MVALATACCKTRSALSGRPSRATGSWKSGLRPAEGGPWWLCWTEGEAVELQSRLAPGPQERNSCCLGGGPVRLYAWLGYVPFSGRRLQYGMKPQMDCTGYGCLGCGTNVWCRRCKEAVVSRSSIAGRRGRTRVSVLQERGSFADATYPARTRAPAAARSLWCRLRSSV